MKPSENPTQAYMGHVKNGVIVLDTPIRLDEGQTVRVEPLAQAPLNAERAIRLQQLRQLFETWTEEDGRLSEEEADRLHAALEQSRGLSLRSSALD